MWGKRRKAEAEAAASLEPAFSQLDMFAGKLDALRNQYNETARELANIKPRGLDIPTPAISFEPPLPAPVALPDKPDGRYSVKHPPDPRTLRPPPPRPTPKKKRMDEPKRTRSGRFYVQIANAKDSESFREVREQLSRCGRVVDSGRGTASDPDAGWLEVAVRAEDTGSFAVKLENMEMKDRVEKLIEVAPGEGRAQARQLDLFRRKQDSSAKI